MVNRIQSLPGRAALWLALVSLLSSGGPAVWAQVITSFQAYQSHNGKDRGVADRLPEKPSFPPAFSVPVEPLGYSAPGAIYLGQRNSLTSLDFLDDNRLLFTFRVPGLMHREVGPEEWSDVRQIRAVVISLPAGTVTAEGLWTVHDRVRYLWMLKDGHFLLRDRDGIEQGDATLQLKPLLHFPGPLLWMEIDPSQQFLVTNSREPRDAAQKPGDVSTPPTAQADMTVDGVKKPGEVDPSPAAKSDMTGDELKAGAADLIVRILRRDSGQVMLVSHSRAAVHLPINSEGYVESLRGSGEQWLMNLNYFNGGSTVLGHVNSVCAPNVDFISQRELLITSCDNAGGHKLVAMSLDGRRLWEDYSSPQAIWPLLVMAPDGSRLVRETLAVDHAINAYSPLDSEDIKGQLVRVIDAASGKIALDAPATPALDAGGNVAIAPSGRRVAILNSGAIEVFDLPAPPPLPEAGKDRPAQ
jgi:hypothetical protein